MSHRSVEAVIGKLVTDEGFRRRFLARPAEALETLSRQGSELTAVELQALLAIDGAAVRAFADVIDPRLQKVDGAAD